MNEIDHTIEELEEEIIENGSIDAYYDFGIGYLDDRRFGDYYKMSKIMADNYEYSPAYYNVFITLTEKVNGYMSDDKYNLDTLSNKDKEEAIKYLKLGAERPQKK